MNFLLLGVRRLHDQGRSGDELSRLLQLLLAAVEFGRQGSADRPHVFSCNFVKVASLQIMLCGLVYEYTTSFVLLDERGVLSLH